MLYHDVILEVNVYLHFSLFNFLIFITMVWGIYKGYMQGFIVQTVALFTLLAGVFIAGKLSMAFYNILVDKSAIPLKNLPVIAFAVLYGPVLFGTNWVALQVLKQVSSSPRTMYTKVLGGMIGAVKYLVIASIFLIFINRFDKSYHIITNQEKQDAFLFKPILKFSSIILPVLEFDVRQPKAQELEDSTVDPGTE